MKDFQVSLQFIHQVFISYLIPTALLFISIVYRSVYFLTPSSSLVVNENPLSFNVACLTTGTAVLTPFEYVMAETLSHHHHLLDWVLFVWLDVTYIHTVGNVRQSTLSAVSRRCLRSRHNPSGSNQIFWKRRWNCTSTLVSFSEDTMLNLHVDSLYHIMVFFSVQ